MYFFKYINLNRLRLVNLIATNLSLNLSYLLNMPVYNIAIMFHVLSFVVSQGSSSFGENIKESSRQHNLKGQSLS